MSRCEVYWYGVFIGEGAGGRGPLRGDAKAAAYWNRKRTTDSEGMHR